MERRVLCFLKQEHGVKGLLLQRFALGRIWQEEFANYDRSMLQRDVLAGITVAAVALPLALAFGVAGGATAAAGMVTAILAGLLIAGLGGASFQISGPTGAMSAVLIVVAQHYGMAGVWVASMLAGVALVLLGVFRLGRSVSFIPAPVITGFTSGIALIIAVGQIDNVLGVTTPAAESALGHLWAVVSHPPVPDWHALAIAGIVMVVMIGLPRLTSAVPGSLVGIILATGTVLLFGWQVPQIGSIPQTILLDQRLTLSSIPWAHLGDLVPPAISIAALGAIESLLCGSVGAAMAGKPIHSDQELIGQGIGNIVIPFFGGVPATAAIARTSVGIKSGAVTRVVSFVHAGALLLSVFALGPLIGRVPLAALGGVLMVTAWRMNEWESIRFFARTRLKHALAGMLITMVATAALDLSQAIIVGVALSAVLYLHQSAMSTTVTRAPVNLERLLARGHDLPANGPAVHVYYLTGPIFFGSVATVLSALEDDLSDVLIISMRGVPMIDATGTHALMQIVETQHHRGGQVYFSGVQPAVQTMFRRAGLLNVVGEQNMFWSADQAIVAAYGAVPRAEQREPLAAAGAV